MAELIGSPEHIEIYRQVMEEIWDSASHVHEIEKFCSGWHVELDAFDGEMLKLITKRIDWDHKVSGVAVRKHFVEVTITVKFSPSGVPHSPTIDIRSE